MIIGTNIQDCVVGGWEAIGSCYWNQSTTGSSVGADIDTDETLPAYFKAIMNAAGVPSDRQEVRLPTGTLHLCQRDLKVDCEQTELVIDIWSIIISRMIFKHLNQPDRQSNIYTR